MELTSTFLTLLRNFESAFTAPSFQTFLLLMAGWIGSVRHRYITDLIVTSDSTRNGHHSDYHRFFSQAKWSIDQLWKILAHIVVEALVGGEGRIILAGDDTLCRRRGLGIFGAGMHHDPLISSRGMKLVSWGHDWVTLCIVIVNPWWAATKVFSLPICMRLYRNKQGLTKGQKKQKRQSRKAKSSKTATPVGHLTRPELMREMLELVASWFPQRKFLFVGDSLYTGRSVLSFLPANVDMIGAVHPQGALYKTAPKVQSGSGRPRKKGDRLPTREEWENDGAGWRRYRFDQFGLHGAFDTKTRRGLYYRAGRDRELKFVLTRDVEGKRPTQIFYSTDLSLSVKEILSCYAGRWSIEVTHHDAKQYLGLQDPANRLPKAVKRTAPMAMFLYSLTIVWFHQHGYRDLQFPNRPWYARKTEPSFADMLTTLRRVSWEDEFRDVQSKPRLFRKTTKLLTYLATLVG